MHRIVDLTIALFLKQKRLLVKLLRTEVLPRKEDEGEMVSSKLLTSLEHKTILI